MQSFSSPLLSAKKQQYKRASPAQLPERLATRWWFHQLGQAAQTAGALGHRPTAASRWGYFCSVTQPAVPPPAVVQQHGAVQMNKWVSLLTDRHCACAVRYKSLLLSLSLTLSHHSPFAKMLLMRCGRQKGCHEQRGTARTKTGEAAWGVGVASEWQHQDTAGHGAKTQWDRLVHICSVRTGI